MGQVLDGLLDKMIVYLEPGSAYRNVIVALATLVILMYVHRLTRRKLAVYIQRQAHKPENAQRFLRAYDFVWKGLIGITVLVAASGSFRLLGLTVALLGTMLGWSLQVPIRGLAAWFMVLLKRPFRIGDRISVAGVTGDVLDIQLNHVILNQVGGTVQGEERSGRGILVPTAMLFGENIINYNYFGREHAAVDTPVSRYMLDEVLVRTTFGSDHELAKKLCVDAARQAVRELVGQTDGEPFTRAEFMAWGVLIRVRYKTLPVRRQEVSSRVTELIWESFGRNSDRVRFCYPGSVARVTRSSTQPPPPMEAQGAPN